MRQRLLMISATLSMLASASLAALPPPPAPKVAALLGQYGSADAPLTLYEDGGRLFADGRGLRTTALTRLADGSFQAPGAKLRFEAPDAISLNGARLQRHDFGAEAVVAIQAKVNADPEKVRAAALAATPPVETGKRPPDLVPLTGVDRRIRLDIRYATSNNFMGFPLYERPDAYMQRPAAAALGRVQEALARQGYGLLIFDAYRPWFVTKMFWDATPEEDHIFLADPAEGSRHNRGCAVDLTLYSLRTGQPVQMTGRYDEMSTRSYPDFVGGSTRQRALRQTLRDAMAREGFTVHPKEWWHFDYKDWPSYGIGTVTFTDLAKAAPARSPAS